MNSQPFDPSGLSPDDQATPRGPAGPEPFFDRAGLAWILACVAIAVAAGHWVPRLTEPEAWQGVARVVGWSAVSPVAEPRDKDKGGRATGVPVTLAGEKERSAKAVSQLQRGMF